MTRAFCGRLASSLWIDPVVVLSYMLPVFAHLAAPATIVDEGACDSVRCCAYVVFTVLINLMCVTASQQSVPIQVSAVLPSSCGKSKVSTFITKCLQQAEVALQKGREQEPGTGRATSTGSSTPRGTAAATAAASHNKQLLFATGGTVQGVTKALGERGAVLVVADELVGSPLGQSLCSTLGTETRAQMCFITTGGAASRLLRSGPDGPLNCDSMLMSTATGVQPGPLQALLASNRSIGDGLMFRLLPMLGVVVGDVQPMVPELVHAVLLCHAVVTTCFWFASCVYRCRRSSKRLKLFLWPPYVVVCKRRWIPA